MDKLRNVLFLLYLARLGHTKIFKPDFEKELNSYVETSMKCHYIPGMTLSVVKGDEVWSHGFGWADIARQKPVGVDTKFEIGSVTKSFTAALLGILLTEKGLNWETKVTDILGPTYEFCDSYRTQELTVKDLLSHRTGLARLDIALYVGISKSVSRSAFCRRLKYLPELLPIRDGFRYNNYMYLMAGHIAEVLGEDSWENLTYTRILQPLGMYSTKFLLSPNDILEDNTAKPYLYLNDDYQNGTLEIYDIYPLEPAGAILSTATDMAKWIKFHLSLGKTESGKQLIKKHLIKDMHRVTTPLQSSQQLTRPMFPVSHLVFGCGYGWFSAEYRGYRMIGHSGALGSYRTYLWIFPDMDVGLFASVNGPGYGRYSYYHTRAVFYYLTDHLFQLEPWLNKSTACSFPEPWRTKLKVMPMELETPAQQVADSSELEGVYGNHLFPDIKVYSDSTDIILKSNRLQGILQPSSVKDRYLWELTNPLEYAIIDNNTYQHVDVTFDRDEDNVVNALTLQFEVDLMYHKKAGAELVE